MTGDAGPVLYADTHAHLDGYGDELPGVLRRAWEAGVRRIGAVGVDARSAQQALELTVAARAAAGEATPAVACIAGLHPHGAARASAVLPALRDVLAQAVAMGLPAAVGEIGLDYFRDLSPRPAQRAAFWAQIEWAHQLKLPVVIHDRDAHADVLAVLEAAAPLPAGGIMHCFSGDLSFAEACLALGLHISFAGPLTYPSASAARAIAARLPLDRLLVETDCPYLAPVPHRGKPNEPAYVVHTAHILAGLRPEGAAATYAALWSNAGRVLFKAPPAGAAAGPYASQ